MHVVHVAVWPARRERAGKRREQGAHWGHVHLMHARTPHTPSARLARGMRCTCMPPVRACTPHACTYFMRARLPMHVHILYNPGGLRVWGWDLRHAGGAPVRVVSVVSRPGGAPPGANGGQTPPARLPVCRNPIDGCRLMVRPVANFGTAGA